jgi:peptidoglycan hydrolase CwlO-like protein
MFHRLSSAVSAARVWVSSQRASEARHKQTLAECRRLKAELKEQQELMQSVATTRDSITGHRDELQLQIRDKDRWISTLESDLELAKRNIEFLTNIVASQNAMIDKRIAQDVAAATKATRMDDNRTESVI